MLTVKNEPIKKQFEQFNIIPPNNKSEDWLYYDLDNLLNKINGDASENASINHLLKGNFLYFKNGVLDKKQLSKNIQHQTESMSNSNATDFIQFAIKTSEQQTLAFNNTTDTLRIIYESCDGVNSTNIKCILNESKINIERIFIASRETIINNYLAVSLDNNSTLNINEINTENEGLILDFVDATIRNNCHLTGLNQSYLSNNSRFQNRVAMDGENATARLNGLCINKKDKQTFYNTHVFHNVGKNESHQLFKSINQDNALFEYNGKVSVKKDAQLINSYQLNQNICLDEYATVHSRPQLFIDADDVKCSHGSTTGDLNKNELFYLMSRGLDEQTSKRMVLRAFIEEVFQDTPFKESLKNIQPILSKIT
jgi:hypothetical protein